MTPYSTQPALTLPKPLIASIKLEKTDWQPILLSYAAMPPAYSGYDALVDPLDFIILVTVLGVLCKDYLNSVTDMVP